MKLVASGVSISECDSSAAYEACIQSPNMIDALYMNKSTGLNRAVPGQSGDKTIHFTLRIQAFRFYGGKKSTIRCLMQHGADPFTCDRRGNTALHIVAAQSGREEDSFMEVILDNRDPLVDSSNIVRQNITKSTALGIAALHNNVTCL